MGRKAKYSKELKLEIVKRYLKGESASALAKEYGMSKSMEKNIMYWARRFEAMGDGGFDYSKTNNSYSKDLKEKIINEYLSGQLNSNELSYKYKISSPAIVKEWVKKYNESGEDGLSESRGRPSSKEPLESINKKIRFCDTLVFDSVSRMSRNSEEGFKDYKMLYDKGIKLIFLNEPLINSEVFD